MLVGVFLLRGRLGSLGIANPLTYMVRGASGRPFPWRPQWCKERTGKKEPSYAGECFGKGECCGVIDEYELT